MSVQQGGVSSYMSLFYASGAEGGPAAISRATLNGINNAPMFNPLSATAVVPTMPSTGIIVSGLYLGRGMSGGAAVDELEEPEEKSKSKPTLKPKVTSADEPVYAMEPLTLTLDQLRAKCNKAGMSCRDKEGKLLPCDVLLAKLGLIKLKASVQ